MSFKDDFVEYFNKNIIHEPVQLRQEYNLENAKHVIFYDEKKEGELERCYISTIAWLTECKLSLDYLTKEMVESNTKERNIKVNGQMQFNNDSFIIISPIASRKPKQAKGTQFDISTVPVNFVNKFNTDYKIHKNKVNTYDTFELTLTEGELEDLNFFKKKFIETFKKKDYTLYHLDTKNLEIEKMGDNNYLVRYFYER